MTECPSCKSKLVTAGLTPGQQFRCASCGNFLRSGESAKLPADKLAWRSFWLGIASIFLIFITGIPAIYYGIRSLLRMRYVKAKSSDRVAAIVGTGLGSFFGLFIGMLAVLIGGFVWYTSWTYEMVDDPAQVEALCEEYFAFDKPAGTIPVQAESVLRMQHVFDFSNSRDVKDRTLRIQLRYFTSNLKANKQNIASGLKSKSVNHRILGQVDLSEELNWDFMEFPDIRIQKTIYGGQPTKENEQLSLSEEADSLIQPVETHQYFGLIRTEQGIYGVAVVFEPENYPMTESEVREIFSNVRATQELEFLD